MYECYFFFEMGGEFIDELEWQGASCEFWRVDSVLKGIDVLIFSVEVAFKIEVIFCY